MVASLNGVIFDQVYGDNSGGAEFDTDGDGNTTQEDEFVSFTNTTGTAIDVSGWQVWSDSTGANEYGSAQNDGLYHTFPSGTVLQPGTTLYITTEYSGSVPNWLQEASEGGSETTSSNSNFLSEGAGNTGASEAIALVDPVSGDFIAFNMQEGGASSEFAAFDGGGSSSNSLLNGFPGNNMIAEIDGGNIAADMNAGSSYQYDSGSDTYVYSAVYIPCFARGTIIRTPLGPKRIEHLKAGEFISTRDHGSQPILMVISRVVDFGPSHLETMRPIEVRPGALGPKQPAKTLCLSPNHRVLVSLPDGTRVLSPVKALLDQAKIRIKRGARSIVYFNLLLPRHCLVWANDALSETFLPGEHCEKCASPQFRAALERVSNRRLDGPPAGPLVGPSKLQRILAQTSP